MSRRWFALGVLTLAVLLIGIDGTVLALATPFISDDLGATAPRSSGSVTSTPSSWPACSSRMGSLGDRIGQRRLLLFGATAFGAVSALTAYAPTAELLIAGARAAGCRRRDAGACHAGAHPRPSSPNPANALAVGIWAATFSAGAALGPVLGGVLLEHFWWGSVFLINVPVMVVLVVGGVLLLPEHRNPHPGPWDLPSVGLSMAASSASSMPSKRPQHMVSGSTAPSRRCSAPRR